MAAHSQIFAATHARALTSADALEAGGRLDPAVPAVALGDLSPFELEELGEVAARVVRFGSGDLEALDVDLDHERLLRLSDFWCEVLAEVSTAAAEDAEVPAEIATQWAASDDVTASPAELLPLVQAIAQLATTAAESGLELYHWSPED